MVYSPVQHIPICSTYMDNGIVHIVIKRAGKRETDDMTLDTFLKLIYQLCF